MLQVSGICRFGGCLEGQQAGQSGMPKAYATMVTQRLALRAASPKETLLRETVCKGHLDGALLAALHAAWASCPQGGSAAAEASSLTRVRRSVNLRTRC